MIDARVYVPVLLLMLLLAGCASFPEARPAVRFDDGLSAEQVFAQCLVAHGGDIREHPGDINLSTDGRWYALIQRIQPIVSDAGFRVSCPSVPRHQVKVDHEPGGIRWEGEHSLRSSSVRRFGW